MSSGQKIKEVEVIEVLPHLAYSTDFTAFDYGLLRLIAHLKNDFINLRVFKIRIAFFEGLYSRAFAYWIVFEVMNLISLTISEGYEQRYASTFEMM